MGEVAIIVPALEHNVYHERGDLAAFGDVSLLDWKLSQLGQVSPEGQIYVSTPSEKISRIAAARGISVIRRPEELSLAGMIEFSISRVAEPTVMWANVTSPFISARDYRAYLDAFLSRNSGHDSLMTVRTLREYVLFQGSPVNFVPREHITRRAITPVQIITNGCFIIERDRALEVGSYMGNQPLLHEVDRLTAMEIKDFEDLSIANDLLTLYMKRKEI